MYNHGVPNYLQLSWHLKLKAKVHSVVKKPFSYYKSSYSLNVIMIKEKDQPEDDVSTNSRNVLAWKAFFPLAASYSKENYFTIPVCKANTVYISYVLEGPRKISLWMLLDI